MADTRSVDSKQTELTNKTAAASQKYALRQYAEAADLYSEATALQAELNGEMDLKNADLLYVYGRCLYHLGVSQSDVLGGKVAGDGSGENAGGKKKRRGKGVDGSSKQDPNTMEDIRRTKEDAQQQMQDKAAEDAVEKTAEGKQALKELEEARRAKESSKPFFQITGDADDWEDEDEDEEEDEQGDAAEEGDEGSETEDDFATAYEILDVARILLAKQAEAIAEHGKGKGKVGDELKQIRERLADTHDLQAEISLENERFADAISDSRASLELKQELFPRESSILAEAHFKLSLALEFASVTAPKDSEGHAQPGKEGQVDEAMRKEASTHMEAAIESSKLRVEKESSKMISLGPEDAEKKRKEIAEVKELIGDMEQRVGWKSHSWTSVIEWHCC